MKTPILCVDDEPGNLEALERIFRSDYKVLKANSGIEALEVLKSNPDIALILSDQRMPEMTGVEFLKKSMESHPNTIRMLLTGYTDIDSVIDAINSGQVYRYLTKPWDSVDLENTIKKGVERYKLSSELYIKNKELKEALNELKTLDQSKTNFMLLINHELKTPLTVLSSFLELLKETTLDDEQTLFTKKIDISTEKLKKLINDVLELLKADLGQIQTSLKKINTANLFKSLQTNVGLANKEICLKSSEPNQEINSDETIINKVLSELCNNGYKFGDKKDLEFVCKKDNDSVFLGVKNTGSEIKKESIDKILSAFTLDEDALNHTTGMGLGLSICQALLKNINSQLEIKSANNETLVGFSLK